MVEKDNPVTLMVDYETKEEVDALYPGDSYRKYTLEDKMKKGQYLEDHILNWGNGRPFIKVYTDILPYLQDKLTKSELWATFFLLPHTSYEDCIIRASGTNRNSHMLTLQEISEAINEKYANGRKIIKSLKDKGILGRFETGVIFNDEDYVSKEVYLMNPYLLFKGENINKTVSMLFRDTIWAKIYLEIKNKEETVDENPQNN